MAASSFQVFGLSEVPMVRAGDDLAELIADALESSDYELADSDIVCVAQKIVSKAEGRLIALASVTASAEAVELARETDKDPRLVELILQESTELLRKKPGVLIMRHRLGLVGAHAGIDQSNIDHENGECALLLPEDPDRSARQLQLALEARTGVKIAVIITDSANRPWRLGTTGIAIGAAGLTVLDDQRGGSDLYGRELKVTLINRADSIATAATLVMGETTERIPVAIVRGLPTADDGQTAQMINRPLEEDLFR
ncbi:MAG: coenzyme F420-0:L-glutamate ligase [Gammaproteobacteria bacterium]|nr:coenzyme F420-0:L-glutamate ligase [Gammaproteobacteria bacterium]